MKNKYIIIAVVTVAALSLGIVSLQECLRQGEIKLKWNRQPMWMHKKKTTITMTMRNMA